MIVAVAIALFAWVVVIPAAVIGLRLRGTARTSTPTGAQILTLESRVREQRRAAAGGN